MLSLKQGSRLVSLARKSISYFLATGKHLVEKPDEKVFSESQGVFVSLHSFPENSLRGCVGFPLPVMPLWQACIKASISAAFEDNRFAPLQSSELDSTIIEVSVLSKPMTFVCSKEKLSEKVLPGKHGLIVSQGFNSGLFLPQVCVEQGWQPLQFLENCCLKAGLPSSSWKTKECKVEYFTAQIFKEEEPKGKVVELVRKNSP